MSVNVQVKMQDEPGLRAYAQSASDPHSSNYRHFLSPQQIGERFGAKPSDYAAAVGYFRHNGLSVGGWPQRMSLAVAGTQAQMQAAFGTAFGVYRRNGISFVAPISVPRLPSSLPIASISNLVHFRPDHSYFLRGSAASFFGVGPRQLARAFDYSGAYGSSFTGAGITIGIIGTAGISAADVPAFANAMATSSAPIKVVAALPQAPSVQNGDTGTGSADPNPGGLATPPPVTAPCGAPYNSIFPTTDCNPEDGEAQLDTEQIATLAPGASVNFYLAYNPADCALLNGQLPNCAGLQGLALPDDEIQQAIADNAADILSLSYGLPENDGVGAGYYDAAGAGFGPSEFAALAAEGIAVFVASGDNGADECLDPQTGAYLAIPCASYPSVDPNVVSVGGTNTPVDSTGKLQGEITAWADQTSGGGNPLYGNSTGSGGGISTTFSAPPWQRTITPAGQSSPLINRGTPDIALNADPLTGPALISNAAFGGTIGASGGTSAAAPDAAAMWSLVLQACKTRPSCSSSSGSRAYRLGNPAPLLYGLAAGTPPTSNAANTLSYGEIFYDVLYGSNSRLGGSTANQLQLIPGYTAGPGYDLVTGLGAPFAGHLIQAVTGVAVP